MSEVKKHFIEDLRELLYKYNASFNFYAAENDGCIDVEIRAGNEIIISQDVGTYIEIDEYNVRERLS